MTTLDGKVALVTGASRGIDILVPNAGVGAYRPFLEPSPDFLEEMIDVNVKGTLYAVRAALPHLLEPMTEASWG
jgi:NADP-dependent 3-hydroxy acid dehydrogenase YdfG